MPIPGERPVKNRDIHPPRPEGRDANDDESLLDVARRAGVPLGNSCGGVGVCARCKVRVVSGAENLSPPTSIEVRFGTPAASPRTNGWRVRRW